MSSSRGAATENDSLSLNYVPPSPIHTPVLTRENTAAMHATADASHLPNAADDAGDGLRGREARKDRFLSLLLTSLRTTHRYSAYAFTGFGLIHFLNTGVAPLLSEPGWAIRTLWRENGLTRLCLPDAAAGIAARTGPLFNSLQFADDNLLAARALYHAPYVEASLIFAPIVLHVGTGICLRILRHFREWYWFTERPRKVALSWQSLAGYVLAPLVAMHVFVNRIVPKALEIDTTAALVGHLLARDQGDPALLPNRPTVLAARAVYGLFVAIGAWHMTAGLAQFLQLRRRVSWLQARVQVRPARWLAWSVTAIWTLGLARVVLHGRSRGAKGSAFTFVYQVAAECVRSLGRA